MWIYTILNFEYSKRSEAWPCVARVLGPLRSWVYSKISLPSNRPTIQPTNPTRLPMQNRPFFSFIFFFRSEFFFYTYFFLDLRFSRDLRFPWFFTIFFRFSKDLRFPWFLWLFFHLVIIFFSRSEIFFFYNWFFSFIELLKLVTVLIDVTLHFPQV